MIGQILDTCFPATSIFRGVKLIAVIFPAGALFSELRFTRFDTSVWFWCDSFKVLQMECFLARIVWLTCVFEFQVLVALIELLNWFCCVGEEQRHNANPNSRMCESESSIGFFNLHTEHLRLTYYNNNKRWNLLIKCSLIPFLIDSRRLNCAINHVRCTLFTDSHAEKISSQ